MKYLLSPLLVFSVYLLILIFFALPQTASHPNGSLILIPFIFFGSLVGFTAHHLIFGLRVRYGIAIMLELLMILLLMLAGFLLGIRI
jgi:hypothetical protein